MPSLFHEKGILEEILQKSLKRQICLNMVDTSKLYVEVYNCISKCTFSLTKYYLSFPIPPTGLEVK